MHPPKKRKPKYLSFRAIFSSTLDDERSDDEDDEEPAKEKAE